MNNRAKDRLAWRRKVAMELGCALSFPLSFRAARFAAQFTTRDELVRWLNEPSTVNTWQMGKKTYTELCLAFGLAVPTKTPRTLGVQLAKAHQRIAELEARIEGLESALKRIRDCDWVISLPDRMDAVRAIARGVLQ